VAHGGLPLTSVAYQGLAGAFSEAAAAALFPGASLLPRRTFAEVFAALEANEVNAAVVPVENTHAGSVADVYDLLRKHDKAKVVAEVIVRVRHCLLGVRGARLEDIRVARSHPQALAQVEDFLRKHGIQPEVAFDTAGAAAEVAAAKDKAVAAVASRRAAERYGLDVLEESIETSTDNFTRFFAVAADGDREVATLIPAALRKGPTKTSLVCSSRTSAGTPMPALQCRSRKFKTASLNMTGSW
jgi:prephenate dehydratase